jgi:hypothetical protein
MANNPDTDTSDDTGVGLDRGPTAGTPLWVKVFGVVALVVVFVFVVLLLAGRGHGPGRHTSASGDHPPSPANVEQP